MVNEQTNKRTAFKFLFLADSEQKEQVIKSTRFAMDQLIERNRSLQQELSKLQTISYSTKQPQRLTEDTRHYEQNNNQY